jgi:RNA polymerase sigma-70 factor, ECF subfamily
LEAQDLLLYIDDLSRYALALARNKTDAEDLLQETYLRALKASESFWPGADLKRWLFRILRNIWFNELRRRRGVPKFLNLDISETYDGIRRAPQADPLALHLASVERDLVRGAIQELPSALRKTICLREYEDLSYQEIAVALDCPVGTVMSRLARARTKLGHRLSCVLRPNQRNAKRPSNDLAGGSPLPSETMVAPECSVNLASSSSTRSFIPPKTDRGQPLAAHSNGAPKITEIEISPTLACNLHRTADRACANCMGRNGNRATTASPFLEAVPSHMFLKLFPHT